MIKLPKKFFKHKTDTVGGKSSMTEHWQRWPTGALSLWSPVLGSQLCCPLKGQHPASSWRPWGWIRTLLGIPIHPSWAFPYTPALFWPRHICTDYVAVLHRRNNLSPRYPRAAQYPAWSRTSVNFFFNWWKKRKLYSVCKAHFDNNNDKHPKYATGAQRKKFPLTVEITKVFTEKGGFEPHLQVQAEFNQIVKKVSWETGVRQTWKKISE